MPGLQTNRMPGAEEDQQRLSFPEEGQGLHCQGQSLEGRMSFLQEGNWMPILLQDWCLPAQGWGKIIFSYLMHKGVDITSQLPF